MILKNVFNSFEEEFIVEENESIIKYIKDNSEKRKSKIKNSQMK